MPTVLREHQHELVAPDGTSVLVFGTEDTSYLTLAMPSVTSGELRTNDADMPDEDGVMFSRDYLGGKTLTFEIGVLTDRANRYVDTSNPYRANLDALDRIEAAWTDPQWRTDPFTTVVLRSHQAGQTWRCYGRPGRYDETVERTTLLGYTPVLATFRMRDGAWYSDTERSLTVRMIPPPEIGIRTPIVSPIRTLARTAGLSAVSIGGSRATWLAVDFIGPLTTPEVTIGGGVRVGLDVAVPDGETITVDTAPWQRSVLRASDGAGMSHHLSRRTTLMSKSALRPGVYTAMLDALSVDGRGKVRIRWRDARARA